MPYLIGSFLRRETAQALADHVKATVGIELMAEPGEGGNTRLFLPPGCARRSTIRPVLDFLVETANAAHILDVLGAGDGTYETTAYGRAPERAVGPGARARERGK